MLLRRLRVSSSMLTPRAAIACGSRSIITCSACRPRTCTSATPSSRIKRGTIRSSVRRSSSARVPSVATLSCRIGMSEVEKLETRMRPTPSGRSARMRSTRSRISAAARSMSVPMTNWARIRAELAEEVELTDSTPPMPPTAPSIGAATRRSTSSGEELGNGATTVSAGLSISGRNSNGSRPMAKKPNRLTAAITRITPSGRRTENSANEVMNAPPAPRRSRLLRWAHGGPRVRQRGNRGSESVPA